MSAAYTVRPISDRSQFTGPAKSGSKSPFVADWRRTEQLLLAELRHLLARNVVLEMDIRERDIKVNGEVRADARPATPAVRLAFDTPQGPMQFATDRFGYMPSGLMYADGWQENVRAIALGLEALRKVQRYGITKSDQQYRGFLQLTGGTVTGGMTVQTALQVIKDETDRELLDAPTPLHLAERVREARINAHPDRHHGDHSRANAVSEAEQVLKRAGRLS